MEKLKTSTLRPGILVSLKTSITGNISYESRVIEPEHVTDAGTELAVWETSRTIADRAEMEAAKKARYDACLPIRQVCIQSAFGLLCPEARADELASAVAEAHKAGAAFNAGAKLTRLGVFVLCGRVNPDDMEAIRSINSEVRELLGAMEAGVSNLDAGAVRAAASRVKSLGEMLAPDAAEKVKDAVEVARAAARKIVKAGEQAAAEIDLAAVRSIAAARTAFLDLDDAPEVAAHGAEAARELDLSPDDEALGGGHVAAPAAEVE